MMSRTFLIPLFLILFSSATSLGQAPTDDSQKLTLSDVIRSALENNRQIGLARDKVRLAEVDSAEMRKHGGNDLAVEIARLRMEIADARFRQVAMEQIAKVENAYWDLSYALRELAVRKDDLNTARADLRDTDREISRGRLDPIERSRVYVQISTAELANYDTNDKLIQSENLLKFLIFPNKDDPRWNVSLIPTDFPQLSLSAISLPEMLKTAMENRAEPRINRIEIQINELNQKVNKDQKAALAKTLLEAEQLKLQRDELESQIQVEVRNQVQRVQNANGRVLEARSVRQNLEMLLAIQHRKFETGESDMSVIREFYNNLDGSRIVELRADTEAAKVLADLQLITGSSIRSVPVIPNAKLGQKK